jgi:hypothetical protein
MMLIAFPAGGSLYYTEDLEDVAESPSGPPGPGITVFLRRPRYKPASMVWQEITAQLKSRTM